MGSAFGNMAMSSQSFIEKLFFIISSCRSKSRGEIIKFKAEFKIEIYTT